MPRPSFALALALALIAGCTVGEITSPDGIGGGDENGDGDGSGVGSGGGDGSGAVSLEVLPPLADMTLGTSSSFDVIVTSDNYSGSVALALEGAPANWQVEFDSPTLSFVSSGALASTMTVTVPTSGNAGAVSAMLAASGPTAPAETAIQFEVEKTYLVPIPNGVGASGAHGFPQDVTIKSGTVVRFVNYDTSSGHTVHANGGEAFPHENDQMDSAPAAGQAGGTYDITTGPTGIYDFYCHDHGENTGIGLITVAP